MSASLKPAVADALTYLITVNRTAARPRDAQQQLRTVQARHPDLTMELVWQEESYDGSLHYDVLLRSSGGATVSLSYCLDRALPWPLRGVRRWSDSELAQVNGEILKIQQAVDFLDIVWNEAPIMKRMIDACLIREELARQPIELSDDELQLGVDGLRRAHKLYTTEATLRWMEQRGLTHAQLERLAADNLLVAKLRDRVAEGRIERYFEDRGGELDVAHIAQFVCQDEERARQVYRDLVAGELDFFGAAQREFLSRAGQGPDHARVAMFTTRRRRDSDELGMCVFAAAPGDVIGPVLVDGSHVIARVLTVAPARLDAPARVAIAEILFEEWLAERRHTARITWYWGTADRTTHAA